MKKIIALFFERCSLAHILVSTLESEFWYSHLYELNVKLKLKRIIFLSFRGPSEELYIGDAVYPPFHYIPIWEYIIIITFPSDGAAAAANFL